MSGLFGFFAHAGRDTDILLEVAHTMGAAMCHTPHQRAAAEDLPPHGALGRISIGLLNQAQQPYCAVDGACRLWICGEFYHQEGRGAALTRMGLLERDADAGALALAVYLRDGVTGLASLDGAFAIAVWDGRSGELILVNDRYGLFPHYYCDTLDGFAFAPEIKGVLAAPGVPRRVDLTAVAQYTRFQQLLGERTWLEDVRMLPKATILRYSPQRDALALERYWDWDAIRPAPKLDFGEAVTETTRLFQRAIDAMTRPPLRAGVYLSGGLDGRTILGFVGPEVPVTTVTFGQAGCLDVMYGTRLAQRAARPNHWFPLDNGDWLLAQTALHLELTEGMHSWMHAHGMSTLEPASAMMDVNLSGWDGGTILGCRLDEYASDAALRHAPDEETFAQSLYRAFCRYYTWPGLTESEAEVLFSAPGNPALRDLARSSFINELARSAQMQSPYRADFFYLDQHVLRSTQSMIVFQRSAMEVRCPFFDYAFVEFIYSLPEAILAGPQLHRAVLTKRAPALARIPHEKDELLPHSNPLVRQSHAALQRAKRGARRVARRMGAPPLPQRTRLYADYEEWLRSDMRAWAEAILFDERTIARGFFNPQAVRSLWERHLRGDEIWTIGKVAPLITLELVQRVLVDTQGGAAGASTPQTVREQPTL